MHPPTLSLPPTTAPDHPQSLPPSHHRTSVCSSVANGTRHLRSHAYCRKLARRGARRWPASLGVLFPANGPLRPLQGAKGTERLSECSPLFSLLLFKSENSEFKELHDVLEKLHLLYLFKFCCCSQSFPSSERGCSISLVKQLKTYYMDAA